MTRPKLPILLVGATLFEMCADFGYGLLDRQEYGGSARDVISSIYDILLIAFPNSLIVMFKAALGEQLDTVSSLIAVALMYPLFLAPTSYATGLLLEASIAKGKGAIAVLGYAIISLVLLIGVSKLYLWTVFANWL